MKYKQLNDWKLISAAKIDVLDYQITSLDYNDQAWIPAVVPGTVVASLVKNNNFSDPYINAKIKNLPGYKKEKNSLFSNHYMPQGSPFRDSWWYKTRFSLSPNLKNKNFKIKFKGINYKANIWFNQKRIATTTSCSGAYRIYEFELNQNLYFKRDNILAVEVIAPQPDDLGITFIDWNPVPPDDCMGIWQPVELEYYNKIAISHSYVQSEVDLEKNEADLKIITELKNQSNYSETVNLKGLITNKKTGDQIELKKQINIEAKSKKTIKLDSQIIRELKIKDPDLWWPYQLGAANLYSLNLKLEKISENLNKSKLVLDQEIIDFGIREVKSLLNKIGSRLFEINGQKIQLRGAAWTSDLILRQSKRQDEIDIDYLKNLNFNVVRLEGKLASNYFWELCNREGILVIAGWPCCNHWEKWDKWKTEDLEIAKLSTKDQLKRLRRNPAFIAWFYGSDFPPPLKVEREYLEVINNCDLDIPILSSAADKEAVLTGKPGVKMSGPYSYVPPQYWYDSSMPGRAAKFNTETGADMCLPEADSLNKFLEKSVEVGSENWNLHTGLSSFSDTSYLEEIVKKRFSAFKSELEQKSNFIKAAQLIAYQTWRSMYEAHLINWPLATGVIGWMLNSAWPSLIWQLYDYYNLPNGAFYGSKKGSELLHLVYNYQNKKVYLVNHKNEKQRNLKAEVYFYNENLDLIYNNFYQIKKINKLDQLAFANLNSIIKKKPGVIFLYLKNQENLISKNVYFLTAGNDIYQPKSSKFWYCRPLAKVGNLNYLVQAKNNLVVNFDLVNKTEVNIKLEINLENKNNKPILFNKIALYTESDQRIAPIYLDNNYISLRENEKQLIKAVIKLNQLDEKLKSELLNSGLKVKIIKFDFN